MRVILLQNIKSLGKTGDIKEVSEGYARNFLLPQKMARIATKETVAEVEAKKAKEKAAEEDRLKNLKELSEKISGKSIMLKRREKDGKLFGKVSQKEIFEELKKAGFDILEKSIIIKEAIKRTGVHEIQVVFERGIEAKIKLEVTGEK